ncbi:MAG: CDP-alcohol phosphatidyltransferase family protein [Dysgonamonadaceae bacterium]|jgi:hypothetical protein|nr:CDP-alcohol phosphatidyltransferase family protein [Dysgonamonadaceae bacterium]
MSEKLPTLESTLKSTDTEEFIDIHFYRPIGYWWALFFNKLGITPNQITIASIFIGVAAGVCFYFNELWIKILGVILLIWANSYDSADGQLARMTGRKSELGRILDGTCGILWFFAIYIALALNQFPEWGYYIVALVLVSGYFHGIQTRMADYYRNIHLLFLKGRRGSELDNSKEVKARYEAMRWKSGFIKKLFELNYFDYTRQQEKMTPRFQEMINKISEKYGGEVLPGSLREEFRSKSLPLMKYTNMLSFNLRAIVLCLSVLAGCPWVYFVFEITVMNIMLAYMVWAHERICREFTERL